MYRLTEKGEEAFQQAMSRSKVGIFPSTRDQVIVDISYGLSPLRGSLLEAEVGGEKGLVDYLRWLKKFVDEGYIEEV